MPLTRSSCDQKKACHAVIPSDEAREQDASPQIVSSFAMKSERRPGLAWVPELAFVAELPFLHTPGDALRPHEFFDNGGGRSPIVPSKERSWQIFGKEKRLDQLQRGELLGKGRLSLNLLRCQNVMQILAFSRSPDVANAPGLIVENE